MDFAHNMYGYRYHTKYDHIDYLSPAVLQRTGDNILALVRKLASSDELTNTDVSVTTKRRHQMAIELILLFFPFSLPLSPWNRPMQMV